MSLSLQFALSIKQLLTKLFDPFTISSMQFSKASKKTNKDELNEGSATKHRRKAGSAVPSEAPSETNPLAKAAAASAGATSDPINSVAIDSVGVITHEIKYEDIAKLAHSYWIARGYTHGSPEEDWLRAERELKTKR